MSDPSVTTEQPVVILEQHEDYHYGRLFRILRARLQVRRFDGKLSDPITRISFERGNSVGVLLYDVAADSVILTRQFRYPVYVGLAASRPAAAVASAWLLEIVAGVQDPGLDIHQVAHKELLEEAGCEIENGLRPISRFYSSPGGSSEQIALFWAAVTGSAHTGRGGGVLAEGEDIELVTLPLAEALHKVEQGEICDAKTIIALQHLALLKAYQRLDA